MASNNREWSKIIQNTVAALTAIAAFISALSGLANVFDQKTNSNVLPKADAVDFSTRSSVNKSNHNLEVGNNSVAIQGDNSRVILQPQSSSECFIQNIGNTVIQNGCNSNNNTNTIKTIN